MTNCYITAHSGNRTAAPVFDLLADPVTLITLLLYIVHLKRVILSFTAQLRLNV